ncbi:MAG TPA: hypothetical protein PLQ32_04425 [Flavihumibacter sp.]|nr:hypothetical protein [Flavihumibacter sp.]HPZ87324.1 hypothetical protein [Flavihumibacter sp.]HQD08178.1 hypothetical protein [Flavihumibacter sp.]
MDCLHCSAPLKGRRSKKFCDDNCRSAWHYRQKSNDSTLVSQVNEQLLQNRRILSRLMACNQNMLVANKAILLDRGFHFQFHTESHIDDRGLTFHFCYEFGYAALDKDHIQLIRLPAAAENKNRTGIPTRSTAQKRTADFYENAILRGLTKIR